MIYPYHLPQLPYASAALEPNLNRATIMQHHDRIFAGHVEKLNAAIKPYPALYRRPLTQLLLHPDRLPCAAQADILTHGGAVYNHTLYFENLAPAQSTRPEPPLPAAIRRDFGSAEDFLRVLRAASLADNREGYSWLLADRAGRMQVTFTLGQATPLPLWPLLNLDLYRHAYELTYGADRTAYVDAALPLINWAVLSRRYEALFARQPPFPHP